MAVPPMADPRYAPGDRVRTAAVDPPHHTRLPRYARGHVGVVVEPQGGWPLADERACGVVDPTVQTVYTVSFAAADLWGAGDHRVTVDLWESYLEPATDSGASGSASAGVSAAGTTDAGRVGPVEGARR